MVGQKFSCRTDVTLHMTVSVGWGVGERRGLQRPGYDRISKWNEHSESLPCCATRSNNNHSFGVLKKNIYIFVQFFSLNFVVT
jgi:hypothetical protein